MGKKRERFTSDEYFDRARKVRDMDRQCLDMILDFEKHFGKTSSLKKRSMTIHKKVRELKYLLEKEMLIDFPDLKTEQFREHFRV